MNEEFSRIKVLTMWGRFKESIIALVYIVSTQFSKEGIPVSKTTVHKLALFARKEGLFPYFNRGIFRHGHWPQDIDRAISENIGEGILKAESSLERVYKTIPGLERQMELIKINHEKVNIERLEQISRSPYGERIRGLVRRLGSDIGSLGNKTKREFIEYLRDEDKYHYISIKWILRKVKQTKEKPTPPPLRELSGLYQLIGKLAYEIIERKEDQKEYVFLIRSIKKAFENHTWLEAKGSPYLQFGHILNVIKETPDELHLSFTDEAYHPWNKIRVILDKKGIFKIDSTQLINKQYFLLGVIDKDAGEPVIKVAALIYVEDVPVDFPQFYYGET